MAVISDFVFGIVAPAGPIQDMNRLELACKRLQEYGWSFKEGVFLRNKLGFLAADDDERYADLRSMYNDSSVTHIWCVRGGYGCTRIIERYHADIEKLNLAKPLIGFSDITALHVTAYLYGGNCYGGYHGPTLLSLLGKPEVDEFSLRTFVNMIEGNEKGVIDFGRAHARVRGTAKGRLIGGNLAILAALCGTSSDVRKRKGPIILFIEDIGELPYRIDRYLVQLRQSGALDEVMGVVVGDLGGSENNRDELKQVVFSHFAHLSIPLVMDAAIGHGQINTTLPYGTEVELIVGVDGVACHCLSN